LDPATINHAHEPSRLQDKEPEVGSAGSTTARMVVPVRGMTCASCVSHVEKALAQVPGVARVAVNLATESAAVEGSAVDLPTLQRAVADAGYEVPTETLRLSVQGMTCASCVARIEAALAAVPGVLEVNVNLASESAAVRAVAGITGARELLAAVESAGYRATRVGEGPKAERDTLGPLRRDAFVALALALPLLVGTHLDLLGLHWVLPAWGQWLLATPVQFWCARRFYVAAWRAVRAGTGNMDLLVSLGTLAAYFLSLYLWLTAETTAGARGALLLRSGRRRHRAGATGPLARSARPTPDLGGDPPACRVAARVGDAAAQRARGRCSDRRRAPG
jgi:P-type Cu+ transporter